VRRSALTLRPNDLLQFRAITDACAKGRRRYDLGEVTEHDEGLAAFKRKWGAQGRRLERYEYPPLVGDNAGGGNGPGSARRVAQAAWYVPLT